MPYALVYVKKTLCGHAQEATEAQCKRFAAAHGFAVSRTVVDVGTDVLPWTLGAAAALGVNAIVAPSIDHIDHRAETVLEQCALMVVHPYGWYHRGSVDLYRQQTVGRRQ